MKYVKCKEEAVEKIIARYPEFSNSRMIGDNSGWCNYVCSVDERYIFRFPKNEAALRSIYNEIEVLTALKGILDDCIQIPDYEYMDLDTDYPVIGYKKIHGSYLSKKLWDSMDEERKEYVVRCILDFLDALHGLNIDSFSIENKSIFQEFEPLYNEIKAVCYPFFTVEEKNATDILFESYFQDRKMMDFKPSVIHGDLSLDHILITENGIGVFDFGDTRIFDPAYDYIWAYGMGNDFYNRVVQNMEYRYRIEEFYIKRTPYYSIIYAVKMQHDEQFQKAMMWMHEAVMKEKMG